MARARAEMNMKKKKKSRSRFLDRFSPFFKRVGTTPLVLGGLASFVAGLAWAGSAYQSHRVLSRAEAQMKKGFFALAAETLDPYRKSLARKEESCKLLVAAYFSAKRPDRLEWVSEACLEAGKEIAEAYIGLAGSREMTGRDGEAVNILAGVAGKFDKTPDIYYALAQILKRNKKDNEALGSYQRAFERAPKNPQLALEATEYAASLQRWNEAKGFVEPLKAAETDNPEVKLFVARVLMKAGDSASAEPLVAQARDLMAKKPEMQKGLEQNYADVLVSAGRNLASTGGSSGATVEKDRAPAWSKK